MIAAPRGCEEAARSLHANLSPASRHMSINTPSPSLQATAFDGSRKLLQSSPPPVAAAYPCAIGDAACFCRWKAATGTFADVAVGCQVRLVACVDPEHSSAVLYGSCIVG